MPYTVQMAVFDIAVKHTMPCGKTTPNTCTAEKKITGLKSSNNVCFLAILCKFFRNREVNVSI